MDLKEAYERIEWQIKHDVDNYDKNPTVAGIIDLERIKEAIDELQSYKQKEDKIRECCMPLITLNNIDCCKECGSTNIKQNYKPYKIAEDILQILNEGDK